MEYDIKRSLYHIRLPLMQDSGWDQDAGVLYLDCEAPDIFILASAMADFPRDLIWRSVMRLRGDAVHAAIRAWDYTQDEFAALDVASRWFIRRAATGPSGAVAIRDCGRRVADWPDSFQDTLYAVVEGAEGGFAYSVRHTVNITNAGYVVNTRCGRSRGDSRDWETEVFIPRGATYGDVARILRAGYPKSLTMGTAGLTI